MEPQTNATRPSSVGLAIKLLWASLAVGVIKILIDFQYLSAMANAALVGFVLVFTLALTGFLILMISTRRNWARIVFLIIFLLGLLPTLPVILTEFSRSPVAGILVVLQIGLQVYALFLLFTKPGAAWFRKADAA